MRAKAPQRSRLRIPAMLLKLFLPSSCERFNEVLICAIATSAYRGPQRSTRRRPGTGIHTDRAVRVPAKNGMPFSLLVPSSFGDAPPESLPVPMRCYPHEMLRRLHAERGEAEGLGIVTTNKSEKRRRLKERKLRSILRGGSRQRIQATENATSDCHSAQESSFHPRSPTPIPTGTDQRLIIE